MKIFVDADACPIVKIVEWMAEKYEVLCTLLCDTNHVLYSDYSEVIIVGAGRRDPSKRTIEDDQRFEESFEKMIRKALSI